MPFKSDAQRKMMFAKAEKDPLMAGVAAEMAAKTPKGKKLPEHAPKAPKLPKGKKSKY